MKRQDLINVGISEECLEIAHNAMKTAAKSGRFHGVTSRKLMKDVANTPSSFVNDEHFGNLAKALLVQPEPLPDLKAIKYSVWGKMDENTKKQMDDACEMPVAVAGAIMPDNHLGFSIPIGGVLALDNAVCPMAVGVDISCSICLSIIDKPPKTLDDVFGGKECNNYINAISKGTRFGVGCTWNPHLNHAVMDKDWNITKITKSLKDKATQQLGTSGSSNHFCNIGLLKTDKNLNINGVELVAGEYVVIMSHSGSRGPGAAVCQHYKDVAISKLDKRYKKRFAHLAWLDMSSEAGQEYWLAMNLMHDYTKANHELIHDNVTSLIGSNVLTRVFNSHNLAWKESHNGQEMYVHRKGATPAGTGVLGIIPGSMASPGFLVVGKGKVESLASASHGAGRKMSRTQASRAFNWSHWKSVLKQRGVRLLSGGLDEMPGAYKDIEQVMSEQSDLVEAIGRIDPKIVMMSADGRKDD